MDLIGHFTFLILDYYNVVYNTLFLSTKIFFIISAIALLRFKVIIFNHHNYMKDIYLAETQNRLLYVKRCF